MAESINLQKCTKEELLFLIERMRRYDMGDSMFRSASHALFEDRLMRRSRLAEEQLKISHDASMAYIDLLKPYEGGVIKDIPLEILEQAQALLDKARAADKKWARLMDLNSKECGA